MTAMTENNDQDSIENAEDIIERFGGIRPMATKMEVPVTTVQGWKKRNVIPANRRDQVMEAAAENDIDLSDLIAGAANENAGTFDLEMSAACDRETEQDTRKPQEAVVTAKRRAAAAVEPRHTNEELIGQIRQAQSVAFTRSASFTIILMAVVAGISVMLLWPSKQQIESNSHNIARLQGEVAGVRENHSFLRSLIPDDLESRFSQIQAQTRDLQDRVTRIGMQAGEIARDVMDENVDVVTRIERAGDHISQLAGPGQLSGMLQQIKSLQQSADGQLQLSGAIGDLNMLMESIQGSGGDLDEALQQAQGEDDALGQTLQGVAPQDLKAAAMLLGLSQFRSSLNRSAPFEEDLALMQKMMGQDDPALQAAIERLAPKAASGVLTPEGLKDEFKGLAGEIVVSSLKGEDVSVKEKARARFNDLLSVEKDGELLTGTDTQATVARAQKMLDEGDVQGALTELQALEGDAAATAQPFINEAQVTLMAEQLQGLMTQKVIRRIGGGSGMAAQGGTSAGVAQLVGEIKSMAVPQRPVIHDPVSGFSILEPKSKYAP